MRLATVCLLSLQIEPARPLPELGKRRMQFNKTTAALVHFIPAGMLVLAIGPWPRGYYMLLRVVVFATALFLWALTYHRTKQFTVWIEFFVVTVFVFNPFAPPDLPRGLWSMLSLIGAALFIKHWIVESQDEAAEHLIEHSDSDHCVAYISKRKLCETGKGLTDQTGASNCLRELELRRSIGREM
jgi:hypothetical protein